MSEMKSLFLEPLDVWLFRDGKPFDAGSDHHADSLFPPLPSVIQGALRSHYLVTEKVALTKANQGEIARRVGTATDFLDLRIRGPFIRKRGKLYFRVPADVVRQHADKKCCGLKPIPAPPQIITNAIPPQLMKSDTAPDKTELGFFSQDEMEEYLQGRTFQISDVQLFERETRYGIGRDDNRRVTQQSKLYVVTYIRPCEGAGLHIEFSGLPNWNGASGVMRIGGEGHGARFSEIGIEKPLPEPAIEGRSKFKLVLLTPTYFEEGWQPRDWNQHFSGGQVKLEAAALHRYTQAGGFDWASSEHKPALRYVAAGSVYYFSADGNVSLKHDWLCDASPSGAQLGQIGFGQILVGNWS